MRALRDHTGRLAGFARITHEMFGEDAVATGLQDLPIGIGCRPEPLSPDVAHPEPVEPEPTMLGLSQATEALHRALRALCEHYFALDKTQCFAAVSPTMEEILGAPSSVLLGRRMREVLATSASAALLRDLPDRLGHHQSTQYLAQSVETGRAWWIVASERSAGWAVVMYREESASSRHDS
jgi:hypothetical protein